MKNDDLLKADFAKRINAILDAKRFASRGRSQRIKRETDIDVTPRAISMWLNGETMPDHKNMTKLAEYLGVEYHWLITGEGPKTRTKIASEQAKTFVPIPMEPARVPARNTHVADLIARLERMSADGAITPEVAELLNITLDTFKATQNSKSKVGNYSFGYKIKVDPKTHG